MDIFYIVMIVIIFGYIIHLETQMKVILEMLEERYNMRSVQMNSKTDFEKSLDKIDKSSILLYSI